MEDAPQRHPLDKERFMGGNKQKWAAIFVVIGIGILLAQSYGLVVDPTPFLGYFTGIGVSFILATGGADVMKAYKVESSTSNYNNAPPSLSKITADTQTFVKEEGVDAPLAKPFGALAQTES